MNERLSRAAKRVVTAAEARRVPVELRSRWRVGPVDRADTTSQIFRERLHRDRNIIVPWLVSHHPLVGCEVLEVGCGPGASTVALAEQGAQVTSVDVAESSTRRAEQAIAAHGLRADFRVANAADLGSSFTAGSRPWVIFWASLEHMTLDERLAALAGAWEVLADGGRLTLIETPNRLWYEDTHTSKLPFYHWIPDELALPLARMSDRPGFGGDFYASGGPGMDHFRRRGRGVSFHEFEAAIGGVWRDVESSLQAHLRRASVVRRAGFRATRHGRYVRLLQAVAPNVPVAFLEPFLYLTIVKSTSPGGSTD